MQLSKHHSLASVHLASQPRHDLTRGALIAFAGWWWRTKVWAHSASVRPLDVKAKEKVMLLSFVGKLFHLSQHIIQAVITHLSEGKEVDGLHKNLKHQQQSHLRYIRWKKISWESENMKMNTELATPWLLWQIIALKHNLIRTETDPQNYEH